MKSILIIYVLFLLSISHSNAQQALQVITRTSEETYDCDAGFLLEIDSEKANITIHKGEAKKIHVVLKQVVKNTNLQLAEKHMDAHKFAFNKTRDRLYLRNYILFDQLPSNITSLFSSSYEITIPNDCYIKITNTLGDIKISDVQANITLKVDYGKIDFNQVEGEMRLNVNIGDLNISNSNANANLVLNNVVTRINGSGGAYEVDSDFGSITCILNESLNQFILKSSNTELTLINRNNLVYNFDINNINASINLLTNEKVQKEGIKSIYQQKSDVAIGEITVNSEFGNVNIY